MMCQDITTLLAGIEPATHGSGKTSLPVRLVLLSPSSAVESPFHRDNRRGSDIPSIHPTSHVTSRHVTSRHVTSRHVTSRHVTFAT